MELASSLDARWYTLPPATRPWQEPRVASIYNIGEHTSDGPLTEANFTNSLVSPALRSSHGDRSWSRFASLQAGKPRILAKSSRHIIDTM